MLSTIIALSHLPSCARESSPQNLVDKTSSIVENIASIPAGTIQTTPTLAAAFFASPTAAPTPRVLSGTVLDAETGTALERAVVSVGGEEAFTDTYGRFRFSGVEPGVEVSVHLEGYEDYRAIWKGEDTLDVALKPRQVTVWVSDGLSSEPLPSATIISPRGQAFTDETGRAELSRLASGDLLTVKRDSYQEQHILYQGGSELRISLEPNVLQGVVFDALSGSPLEGATIALRSGSQLQPIAVSDVEGRYSVQRIAFPASLFITAPGYLPAARIVSTSSPLTVALEPFIVKGVYIPFGLLYLKDRLLGILDLVDRTELNAIVVDVKSDRGRLAYESQLEIAREGGAYHPDLMDLKELLRLCAEKDIYTIARVVTFKDPVLASVKPEWAIKRADGTLYVDLEGLTWGDPFRQEVRDYNIGIAKEIAAMGFDEIQFDYLRFPSDGVISNIQYPVTNTLETRTKAIEEFCAQAYRELKPLGVMVSAAVFGLTVWVRDGRDMGIGQRVIDIAPHVDYISPMVYPSTFAKGNLGLDEPALHPYEVVYRSCIATRELTKTKLRPWLQHYSLYGVEYDIDKLLAQKQAVNDAKTYGWLFWNAGGKYNRAVFAAPKPKWLEANKMRKPF